MNVGFSTGSFCRTHDPTAGPNSSSLKAFSGASLYMPSAYSLLASNNGVVSVLLSENHRQLEKKSVIALIEFGALGSDSCLASASDGNGDDGPGTTLREEFESYAGSDDLEPGEDAPLPKSPLKKLLIPFV